MNNKAIIGFGVHMIQENDSSYYTKLVSLLVSQLKMAFTKAENEKLSKYEIDNAACYIRRGSYSGLRPCRLFH